MASLSMRLSLRLAELACIFIHADNNSDDVVQLYKREVNSFNFLSVHIRQYKINATSLVWCSRSLTHSCVHFITETHVKFNESEKFGTAFVASGTGCYSTYLYDHSIPRCFSLLAAAKHLLATAYLCIRRMPFGFLFYVNWMSCRSELYE